MAKGGSRYGAGRPGYKATAESLQRVDVRLWAQRGYFADHMERHFSWSWTRGGEPSGNIAVHTTSASATLTYRTKSHGNDEWQDRRDYVSVSQTPCRYGGLRHWFHCPACNRRCEVLYLRAGRFACRHCQRVAYTSQSGGVMDRMAHKMHKLRARIENGRPKGMRWANYERLIEQVCTIEELIDREFARRVGRLLGVG
jgi:hypothetical protein